jgi:hypothetical protein
LADNGVRRRHGFKMRWRRCGLAAELPARPTSMDKPHADWDI